MKTKITVLYVSLLLIACKKQDNWLDEKSNIADIIPKSIQDFRAIIDNDAVLNSNYPSFGLISADNYYVTFNVWQALANAQERNAYTWAAEIYEGESSFDWNRAYNRVTYSNTVLNGLSKLDPIASGQSEYDKIMGAALFFRAHAFFDLLQVFAAPYDSSLAMGLGVPLRLSSNINDVSTRASLQESYDQIISDLITAESLLPASDIPKTRPAKTSSQALLARIFHSLGKYDKALEYADKALTSFNSLLDYNTLSTTAALPFPTLQNGNPEILFYATTNASGIINNARLLVDTTLYKSYPTNDLRKDLFYKNNGTNGITFKGYYTGVNSSHFSGISSNELYLIKAECLARASNITDAMKTLNDLIRTRWKKVNGVTTYVNQTATDVTDALNKILAERRKELPFTGQLRWSDLRRLNKESRFEKTLNRVLNGQNYSLPPNDMKYVLPIPEEEIKLSGIQQNPR